MPRPLNGPERRPGVAAPPDDAPPFAGLGPEAVVDAVESLGLRCDGRVLALNSYENRVLRVGLDEAPPVVVKFYRPRRWTEAQILEEHAFVLELHEEGLSVVPPRMFHGQSLHTHDGRCFAIFPLQGGHAPEMERREVGVALGETLGRLHAVGARQRFDHRETISVDGLGEDVEVWADGEWEDLEGEVEVDVDAFDEPMIVEVDDVPFRAAWEAERVDAEAEAEKAIQRQLQQAVQQAMGKIGFF